MNERLRTFLDSPKLLLPAVLVLIGVNAVGIYQLVTTDAPRPPRIALAPPKPKAPPPPAMITPPPVAAMLQSGTLIVISKKSQHMFVFSDGALWASTPISTGKRRHETPSGVFPILQKRKYHRSNIYSGAPMPYMQRLTWGGIALHAGRVPGYAASHGCIRMPTAFAQSLFKLTSASATTVVIGDDPLENEVGAQQFALTAQLPVFAALAPPAAPPKVELAVAKAAQPPTALVSAAPPLAPQRPSPPNPAVQHTAVAAPYVIPDAAARETIQLTAAATPTEAEAHWTQLLSTRPDLRRFEKIVAAASVNSRPVYRLRISGTGAHSACVKLKSEGIGCFAVS